MGSNVCFYQQWDLGTLAFTSIGCLVTAAAYTGIFEQRQDRSTVTFRHVMFPIWILMFIPPFALITLAFNWILDSLVLTACYFIFNLAAVESNLREVWSYGILAHIIGAMFLYGTGFLPGDIGFWVECDPYGNQAALFLIVCAMLISALFTFQFNYMVCLKHIEEKPLRFKVALTLALLTMPWPFLISSNTFYQVV